MVQILFVEVDTEDAATITAQLPEATVLPGPLQPDSESLQQYSDIEILSCFVHSRITEEVLDALPSLKLICTRSVGYDHIDLQACSKRGIQVCNVPDYGSHVIAEHVFALLLGTLRHVHEADERVQGGSFEYQGLRGMALRGKTIGIVGTGKIGRCVARIAHGFDMNILATDQCRTLQLTEQLGVQYVEIHKLLAESDIITLHIPATEQTHHMLNEEAFRCMKQGVVLVNTARGALIDSKALLSAVESGIVAHALLDVLEHEENFQDNKALIDHPRVVTTPHIAFYADDSMRNMYADCFQTIDDWESGRELQHCIQEPKVVCDLSPIAQQ